MLAGCAGSLVTATEMPKAPRRPDGVVLEPPSALPAPVHVAPAYGVVALREPLAGEDVENVVRAYLQAFERGDMAGLRQMLASDAAPLERAGAGRAQLIERWSSRMEIFETLRLSGVPVVAHFDRIETYTYDALGGSSDHARPPAMQPGDLYVRVPVAVSRITEQLFGNVLVLLLRQEKGHLLIAGQGGE